MGIPTPHLPTEESVFVGSIDQGTTSSRFLIFDHEGKLIASHQEARSVRHLQGLDGELT